MTRFVQRHRGPQAIRVDEPEEILRLDIAVLRRQAQLVERSIELLGAYEHLGTGGGGAVTGGGAAVQSGNPRFEGIRDRHHGSPRRDEAARGEQRQQAGAAQVSESHAVRLPVSPFAIFSPPTPWGAPTK